MSNLESDHPRKRLKTEDGALAKEAEPQASILTLQTATFEQTKQEEKFGVNAFVSRGQGFSCVLKQRYTDFLVNEIDNNGHVVHLQQLSRDAAPERNGARTSTVTKDVHGQHQVNSATSDSQAETNTPPVNGATSTPAGGTDGEIAELTSEDATVLKKIFGDETTNFLSSLYTRILKAPNKKPKDFPQHVSEPIEDKQVRTDAHVAVRRIFKNRIETVTGNESRIQIKAASSSTRKDNRGTANNGPQAKGKVGWDELGGEYLHFTLYKENKDTMEVLVFLASQLKMHAKVFQFAGTKDRRGVTAQRVCAFRVHQHRLESLNSRLRGARLSGFEYKKHGLGLGDLQGNEFGIALRDCTINSTHTSINLEDLVSARIASLKEHGFLNYYGLQRFGTHNVSTDEIGRRMLQGDLRGAVDGILSFEEHLLVEDVSAASRMAAEDIARAQGIDAWNKTHKASAAFDKLPRRFQAENAVIRHLSIADRRSGRASNPDDFQGALSAIPRNLRLMYVHAYQSRIWNEAASQRFELYGLSVVEGDLVIYDPKELQTTTSSEHVDDTGEVVIHPTGADSATAAEDRFERARPLTKSEAESGLYSIFDIVLPQPGFDVAYPANAVGKFYEDIMAKDSLDPHDMRRKWRDVSMSGSYRKIMARPESVSFELRPYTSDEDQLFLTDLDRVEGRTELPPYPSDEGVDRKTALLVRMQLRSSQYATMALRELTGGGAVAFKPDYSGR